MHIYAEISPTKSSEICLSKCAYNCQLSIMSIYLRLKLEFWHIFKGVSPIEISGAYFEIVMLQSFEFVNSPVQMSVNRIMTPRI